MNTPLGVSIAALLAIAVAACAATAPPVSSLRSAGVDSADSAPDVKAYQGQRPGQFALIKRSFDGQPPLVPHSVEGYDITPQANDCWDCHNSDDFKGRKMPMVGKSHLIKTADRNAEPQLNMLRYQCNSCHVQQVDAKPLVDNDFKPAPRQ